MTTMPNSAPLCIDLYSGLHGWADGFLAEGYRVKAFDIVDMCKELGHERKEGIELFLRDVRSLHGSEFADATVIVASPPCQEPSYRAMPWKRAKALNAIGPPHNFIELFNACFRIQREASEAAGRYIPLIVENVKGAQPWVGRARWHYGSFYLWGDVPALMPITLRPQKFNPDGTVHPPGSWFAIADSKNRGAHTKVTGQNWSNFNKTGEVSPHWRMEGQKTKHGTKGFTPNGEPLEKNSLGRKHWSNSTARKAASAQIAKIPFPLAQHIARAFKPQAERTP